MFLFSAPGQVNSRVQSSNRMWAKRAKVMLSVFLSLGLVFAGLTAAPANASDLELSLVKDINQTTRSAFNEEDRKSVAIGNIFYFDLFGYDESTNTTGSKGIWRSDGTEAGTTLVKAFPSELNYGIALYAMGDKLFFSADDGVKGPELWVSDGTLGGTELLKDINVGDGGSRPYGFTELNGTLYFFASSDGSQIDIWKTDGTEEGTEIHRKNLGQNPEELTALGRGETFLFRASDSTNGAELWTSEGDEPTAGETRPTKLLEDINPDKSNFDTRDSYPQSLTQLNHDGGTIYFNAGRGWDKELWKSDGTVTELVTDVAEQINGSDPGSLTAVGNNLFFIADDGANGRELWSTDGTVTAMVKDIADGSSVTGGIVRHPALNEVYFSANDGTNGNQLWRSNGTESGTTMISNVPAVDFSSIYLFDAKFVGSTLMFMASSSESDDNLWRSDGTSAGTTIVRASGGNHSRIMNATSNKLFLKIETDQYGLELWASDGSSSGTVLVRDIDPISNHGACARGEDAGACERSGVVIGSTYFFPANDGYSGTELWKSDGTRSGTVMVKDIYSGSRGSGLSNLTFMNGILYFSANTDESGEELWRSDGTAAGTRMVMDIWEGDDSSEPDDLTVVGDVLYFTADDGADGRELWKSDGTQDGAVMVENINAYQRQGSDPSSLTVVGNTLYFTANDADEGEELWKSNGTELGTVMVKDIWDGSDWSEPRYLTAVGETLFFSANDGFSGRELWKTDDTESELIDLVPGPEGSSPAELAAVGTTLYFSAQTSESGNELWMLTADGVASMVKDIWTDSQGSYPYNLTAFGNDVYFVASDDENSYELWKSNGTPGGTVMVKDIHPSSDSYPEDLTVFAGNLYFGADDGVSGYELWKSDGTSNGTLRMGDINPDSGSSPSYLAASATTLFFSANNGTFGTELWKLGPASVTDSSPPTDPGSGSSPGSGVAAPVAVPETVAVPRTIKKPSIQKAVGDKPARLLGRSLTKGVIFGADSARLSSEAKQRLRQAVKLAKASGGKVAVTGFAARTSRGSAYERSIAQKRALAVARYIRAQGFDGWIYYHGLSGRQSLAFEGNPRRVEIRILK